MDADDRLRRHEHDALAGCGAVGAAMIARIVEQRAAGAPLSISVAKIAGA